MANYQQFEIEEQQQQSSVWDIISRFIGLISSFFTRLSPRLVTFNGRKLEIVKELGQGGFGIVYLVRSRGDLYALKCIRIQLPEQESRLMSEIGAHQKVVNLHVLKLIEHQLVRENGRVVEGRLLLPYYSAGSVQDVLDKQGSLPLSRIIQIGLDVCKGLHAFHSANPPLAYRDLKPANILLDENGSAVLIDLGSTAEARLVIASRRESVALAEHCAETVTAPFRAPELFDPSTGSKITEATDIWALGCTLYAMMFKTSPFDGSMTDCISGQVEWPDKDVNPIFKGLIQGILQVQPNARPTLTQIQTILEKLSVTQTFTERNF